MYDLVLFIYFWILLSMRIGFYVQCNKILDESRNLTKGQNETANSDIEACYEKSLGLVHVYAIYFILWVIRVFQFFAVSRFLGPKVIMLKMMVGDLLRIIIFIALASCSFGLWMDMIKDSMNIGYYTPENKTENGTDTIQAMRYVETVFADPFWNLFGDGLRNFHMTKKCETDWNCNFYFSFMKTLVVPLFRFIYMLLAGVLLLNLLIAIFSNRIQHVTERSNQIWNIYRKDVLLEFYHRHFIPIPLSLFTDAIFLIYQSIRPIIYNPCGSSKRTKLFKATPLKMTLVEEKNGNSETKISMNNSHFDRSKSDNVKSSNESNTKGNYMQKWFQLVTNWETDIHREVERKKATKEK